MPPRFAHPAALVPLLALLASVAGCPGHLDRIGWADPDGGTSASTRNNEDDPPGHRRQRRQRRCGWDGRHGRQQWQRRPDHQPAGPERRRHHARRQCAQARRLGAARAK